MPYDHSKFEAAVTGWLATCCKVGYGQVYSGELLQSFENYLRETAALKSTPGMNAFSKEMNRREFGRKRVAGLQYMTGLELLVPIPNVVEQRLGRGIETGLKFEQDRKIREAATKDFIQAELDAKAERKAVKQRMKQETRERIANAGKNDPTV